MLLSAACCWRIRQCATPVTMRLPPRRHNAARRPRHSRCAGSLTVAGCAMQTCMHACGAVSLFSMLVRFDAHDGRERAPPSAINSTAKPPPHLHQHCTPPPLSPAPDSPLRHRWHRAAPSPSSAPRSPPSIISTAQTSSHDRHRCAAHVPATTISTAQPPPLSSALRSPLPHHQHCAAHLCHNHQPAQPPHAMQPPFTLSRHIRLYKSAIVNLEALPLTSTLALASRCPIRSSISVAA